MSKGTFGFRPKAFGLISGYWSEFDENEPRLWGTLFIRMITD